jgi:hypothetical protein
MFTIFPTGKRSPSHSSRLSPTSNIGGKLTGTKVPQKESGIYGVEHTWYFFVDVVKEQYYPIYNYENQYIRWTTLQQEKSQRLLEFTNTFHILRTKLGIKDSERHLVLKYRGVLHRQIQIEMDFLNISSLGVAYRYVVKIEQKFRHRNKWEFGSANLQQPKHGKYGPNQ